LPMSFAAAAPPEIFVLQSSVFRLRPRPAFKST
jgi:hypothetical protein